MIELLGEPRTTLDLIVALVAGCTVLSSAEVLASLDAYRSGGIFAANVAPPKPDWLRSALARVFQTARRRSHPAGDLAIARIVVAAVMALPFAPLPVRIAAAVASIVLSEGLSRFASGRVEWGDQVLRTMVGAAAIGWVGGSTATMTWALWFITAQVLLMYAAAGVFKLGETSWRSGYALWQILSADSRGWPPLGNWLRAHPRLTRILSWGTIVWEAGIPLTLLLPEPMLLAALGIGVLFHVACALTMGLNTYLWAFVSAYPAILFTHAGMGR